jgi:hypothetical protein
MQAELSEPCVPHLKVRDVSLEPLARCMLVDPRGCHAGIDGSLCAQMYLITSLAISEGRKP